MKAPLFFTLCLTMLIVWVTKSISAQAPLSFPYQAVARDSSGNLYSNQNLSIRFSIRNDSSNGTVLYQEAHNITTNTLGLFQVNIGQGTIQNGSFQAIDWAMGNKFIQVELDPTGGSMYTDMGTTRLLSVPYALHAGSAGNVYPYNGLQRSEDSIGLGGRLKESTSIVLDGQNLGIYNTDGSSTAFISQNNFSANQSLSSGSLTQTFTAGATKRLQSIELRLTALPGSTVTLTLLNAQGTVIASQSQPYMALFDSWQGFNLSSQPLLEKNKVYTIQVSSSGTATWYYSVTNVYPQGNGNLHVNMDYAFILKVLDELPVLHVSNQQVGIGTTIPATTLDINGQIRIQGGSPSLGKVLSCDATGIGTWLSLTPDHVNAWGRTGNAGTNPAIHFLGTTDNKDLRFRVNNILAGQIKTDGNLFLGIQAGNANSSGIRNIALGTAALFSNISASNNVAIGDSSLFQSTGGFGNCAMGRNSLKLNTSGDFNIAIGDHSMYDNISGSENTAIGDQALANNTTGSKNIAIGSGSLNSNTTGFSNIILGDNAGYYNISGEENIAMGSLALYLNSSGRRNVAIGRSAMYSNTTGFSNIAIGARALYDNTSVSNLVAIGDSSLMNNTTGNRNTAIGSKSLLNNTTGNRNTAVGVDAMKMTTIGGFNTAVGYQALLANTGYNNTAVGVDALHNNTSGGLLAAYGFDAGSTNVNGEKITCVGAYSDVTAAGLENAVALGWASYVNTSHKVRLGSSTTTSIEGQVAYSFPSDARFKHHIKENVPGLDFITRLKPVTYHFDAKKFDEHILQLLPDSVRQKRMQGADYQHAEKIVHTGFLAQDIERICNDLHYDFDGLHIPDPNNVSDNYSVSYSQFIMPLVKGMQEQQQMISALKSQLQQLETRLQQIESGTKIEKQTH